MYKTVTFDDLECQRSKLLKVESPFQFIPGQVPMFTNVEEGDDCMLELDLREWVEPCLEGDVGIGRAEFALTYFSRFHNLFVGEFTQELKSLLLAMTTKYSLAYMTASFLRFLVKKIDDPIAREKLQNIHTFISHRLEKDFPPVLVCLNVNGTIALRTKKRIE